MDGECCGMDIFGITSSKNIISLLSDIDHDDKKKSIIHDFEYFFVIL